MAKPGTKREKECGVCMPVAAVAGVEYTRSNVVVSVLNSISGTSKFDWLSCVVDLAVVESSRVGSKNTTEVASVIVPSGRATRYA